METNNLSYEEAVSKLEKILKELEDDNCTLKESLDKFKKGIELYNYCSDLLTKADGEIKILLKDDGMNIKEVEFPMEV